MTTAAAEPFSFDASKYDVIQEGAAKILNPKGNRVFYNKVQVRNRDVSIAAINTFAAMRQQEHRDAIEKKASKWDATSARKLAEAQAKGTEPEPAPIPRPQLNDDDSKITILEGLSATGLRSARYAKEIPRARKIVCNDVDADAVKSIAQNMAFNEISPELVVPSQADANLVMYQNLDTFDVIDLDPYGTASPFMDAAVRSVKDGGLLCVTCTDMAVLCGKNSETCWAKYQAMSVRNTKYCHEMGLRIMLGALQNSAVRYKRYIEPLMSCSIDFYGRVFVRVRESPFQCKLAASKMGLLYQSTGCPSFHLQAMGRAVHRTDPPKKNDFKFTPGVSSAPQRCPETGKIHHVAGPLYIGPIHSSEFATAVADHMKANQDKYASLSKMHGLVRTIADELSDVPLFYDCSGLAAALHCTTPPAAKLRSAILNAGYRVSQTHCNPQGIKTDCPNHVLWDIMRCWVKLNPVRIDKLKENSPARAILAKEPEFEADFTIVKGTKLSARHTGVKRFLPNPEQHWGPKQAAGKRKLADTDGLTLEERMAAKRKANQGSRTAKKAKQQESET